MSGAAWRTSIREPDPNPGPIETSEELGPLRHSPTNTSPSGATYAWRSVASQAVREVSRHAECGGGVLGGLRPDPGTCAISPTLAAARFFTDLNRCSR